MRKLLSKPLREEAIPYLLTKMPWAPRGGYLEFRRPIPDRKRLDENAYRELCALEGCVPSRKSYILPSTAWRTDDLQPETVRLYWHNASKRWIDNHMEEVVDDFLESSYVQEARIPFLEDPEIHVHVRREQGLWMHIFDAGLPAFSWEMQLLFRYVLEIEEEKK